MTDTDGGAAQQASGDRPRISVLLVDDQRFVGLALARLLATEKDMELHCCHDAMAAIADANRVAPTVILQDLVLPGIDGLTIVGMFRTNAATSETPIIVLSGNDDADTRAKARHAGANDYLVKLPAKGDLIACIRRHADRFVPEGARANPSGERVAPASVAPAGGETLDPAVMATFRHGPPSMASFAFNLFDQFILEAQLRVETLRDASTRRDQDALTTAAHSLKGSSLIMGAQRLGALCAQVEDGLGAGAPAVAPALMAALDHELGLVRAAFALERQHIQAQGTPQI